MSKSVALITNAMISRTELSQFIVEGQGSLTEDDSSIGSFTRDGSRIWIDLSQEDLHSKIKDDGKIYENKLISMLGGSPLTFVVIEISRRDGSDLLALDFAVRFSARWSTVLDDLAGHLFGHDELIQRSAAGQGI